MKSHKQEVAEYLLRPIPTEYEYVDIESHWYENTNWDGLSYDSGIRTLLKKLYKLTIKYLTDFP